MSDKKKDTKDVKFLTSLALAVNDIDGELKHIQLSIVQEVDSKQIRAFFDVVDPSKVKVHVPESDNA